MFREFFTFEMRFRLKSLSTYVYFLMWTVYSFLCVASESFGPIGTQNGKVLLNGPYATTTSAAYATVFGIIVIAAIFGTSVLRDFQRDTYQLLFTKPITKFAYLGGRWAGSFVTCIGVFTGVMLAPGLGRSRRGPITPALARITSGGICSRSCRSSWCRSSFWAPCFSPSVR